MKGSVVVRDGADATVARHADECQPLGARLQLHHRDRGREHLVDWDRRTIDWDVPCVDTREGEQVVDEAEEVAGCTHDARDVGLLLLGHRAAHPIGE